VSTLASTSVDLARAQFATTSLHQGWTYYVFRARITGEKIARPTSTI